MCRFVAHPRSPSEDLENIPTHYYVSTVSMAYDKDASEMVCRVISELVLGATVFSGFYFYLKETQGL